MDDSTQAGLPTGGNPRSPMQAHLRASGHTGGRGAPPIPPLTLGILVLCGTIWAVLNFWKQPGDQRSLLDLLAPSVFDIWAGAYWTLITSAFVHLDAMHGLFNMWWTKDFGRLLEPRFGFVKFAAFVLSSAIVSSGMQLAFFGQTGIGFSGVVYAFFGYMLAARDRDRTFGQFLNKNTILWMLGWLVLCIFLTAVKVWNVANGAHLAGLIFGYLLGIHRRERWYYLPAKAAAAILAISSLVPAVYMPWAKEWRMREFVEQFESAE